MSLICNAFVVGREWLRTNCLNSVKQAHSVNAKVCPVSLCGLFNQIHAII